MPPTTEFERRLAAQGYTTIAGIDEVGRGCWAGPVVAAAVVFDPLVYTEPSLVGAIDDSKTLSARQRTTLAAELQRYIRSSAVGWVAAHDVDVLGIMEATRTAMQQAVFGLRVVPDALLIDAVRFPHWPIAQTSLIHGDARSLSIAAASIIAKVTRDAALERLDRWQPGYGYARHKGYGTALHRVALQRHGPTAHHRHTYAPIRHFHLTGTWAFDATTTPDE
jgi:ribonuclease HII